MKVWIIWNGYPGIAKMLSVVQSGQYCDHCAIEIDNTVYESTAPVARKMSLGNYYEEMVKWSQKHQSYRYVSGQKLFVETFPVKVDNQAREDIIKEAERWMGTPYSMLVNFLLKKETIHCSEFCGRIMEVANLVKWPIEYSRIKPLDVRDRLVQLGSKPTIWRP